jgi:hypothetical protein
MVALARVPVVGYARLDRIFYLDGKEFGAHLKQDRRLGAMARPEVPERVHDLAAREGKSVLLVLSYRLSAEEMASLGGQFLKGFDSPSIIGESYFFYLYPWKPSTPAVAAETRADGAHLSCKVGEACIERASSEPDQCLGL